MTSWASTEKKTPVRRQTWPPSAIFDLSCYLLRNYGADSILMFASISSCACTDKKQKQQQQKMVHRQIWPFGSGSNFVKFPIYRLVIASLQRSLGILFLNFLCQHERTNVLTNIQVSRCNVWDRVRYLHSKFQTNLHTFADKYERMTNTRL